MKKQIYLIVDAEIPLNILQKKLKESIYLIDKIQLYHTQKVDTNKLNNLIAWLIGYNIDCYLYEDKKSLALHPKLGIHLDNVEDLTELETKLNRKINKGVTISNDLEKIKKAEILGYDYISFCSVFPSKSANTCELVSLENIKKAKKLFSKEIFLAGGITPETQKKLSEIEYNGVAVISAIMDSDCPLEIIKKLK